MQNQYILKHVKLKKKDIGNVYSGQRSAIQTAIFWKHSKFAMLNSDSESKLTVFKVLNT